MKRLEGLIDLRGGVVLLGDCLVYCLNLRSQREDGFAQIAPQSYIYIRLPGASDSTSVIPVWQLGTPALAKPRNRYRRGHRRRGYCANEWIPTSTKTRTILPVTFHGLDMFTSRDKYA